MSAIISCREASRLASTAIDRPLSWRQRFAMHLHLLACRGCRVFRRQIRLLDRLMRHRHAIRGADQTIRLSPEARARLSAAMRQRRS